MVPNDFLISRPRAQYQSMVCGLRFASKSGTNMQSRAPARVVPEILKYAQIDIRGTIIVSTIT
jgi:hypothetical protein